MRKIEKKKSNPFLIFTVILLIGIASGFIIKINFFTAKETNVSIDENVPKTTIRTQSDAIDYKPSTTEDKNLNYRNNWKEFISIATLHKDVDYTIAPDGKVTKLNVPLINKTDYTIESITIKVYYIDPENRNTLEIRNFEIKNILPGNRTSYPGPESNVKGVTVACEIVKIHSANFGFCFDQDLSIASQSSGGYSGNPADPWHCK